MKTRLACLVAFLMLANLAPAAAEEKWARHSPEGAGFSAEFPSKPAHEADKDDGSTNHIYSAETAGGAISYMVMTTELPKASVNAGSKAIFDGIAAQFGKNVKKRQEIKLDGHAGVELVIEIEDGGAKFHLVNRIYLVKNRLYQVMATSLASTKEKLQAERFAKSFRLTKVELNKKE